MPTSSGSKRWAVYWTPVAMGDLAAIVDYISQDSPTNAQGVFTAIRAKARTLEFLPTRGAFVPELRRHGSEAFRQLLEGPWRIVYRIAGRQVVVYAVLDSRRDLEEALVERFLRQSGQ
jgi:toxin ParE1/3/4